MMKALRPVLSVVLALAAAGCMTDYQAARAARHNALYGDGTVAAERARKQAESGVNHALGAVETARLKQYRGDFAGSSGVLGKELDRLFDETMEGPVLKKSEIGGQILAGTFADDTVIPYELPAYELLFALQYQYLNALCSGDRGNAAVYLRRATRIQGQLKEENASVDQSEPDAAAAKAVETVNAEISAVADTVRAAYENSLAWYLAGFNLEAEGDPSNAGIAYREAARIAPEMARLPRGRDDILVVYEEGVVDQRQPIKVPLPIGGTVVSLDFPVYRGGPYRPAPLTVEYGGVRSGLVRAVDVQALAYRDLKDRIPGIAVRNVSRTALKVAAQQVANHVNTGNNAANAAIMLGVLGYNIFHTAASEADTRTWLTLPECVRVARFARKPGATSAMLRGGGGVIEIPFAADLKGPLLAWVTDTGAFSTVTVVSLRNGPATWYRTGSLVGAGDGRFLCDPRN